MAFTTISVVMALSKRTLSMHTRTRSRRRGARAGLLACTVPCPGMPRESLPSPTPIVWLLVPAVGGDPDPLSLRHRRDMLTQLYTPPRERDLPRVG